MDGHLSSLGWSPTSQRIVTHQKEVNRRLEIWHLPLTHKTNTRWQLWWIVTYHSRNGHPLSKGWSPTNQNLPEGSVLLALNLAHRFNSQNQDHWMVSHPPKDGHPPTQGWLPTIKNLKEFVIWHQDLTHKIKAEWSAMDSWPPSMVTHHPKSTRRKCTTDMEFGTYT